MTPYQLFAVAASACFIAISAEAQVNKCLVYSSCAECARDDSCGWAHISRRCIEDAECAWGNGAACYPGTHTGPAFPYSTSVGWVWDEDDCSPSTNCPRYTDCLSCSSRPVCVWGGSKCRSGADSDGLGQPLSSVSRCPSPFIEALLSWKNYIASANNSTAFTTAAGLVASLPWTGAAIFIGATILALGLSCACCRRQPAPSKWASHCVVEGQHAVADRPPYA
jgi:hypothetical protein